MDRAEMSFAVMHRCGVHHPSQLKGRSRRLEDLEDERQRVKMEPDGTSKQISVTRLPVDSGLSVNLLRWNQAKLRAGGSFHRSPKHIESADRTTPLKCPRVTGQICIIVRGSGF